MAFKALNGFDVEAASSMLVYENIMPEIQHINGKGCIDKFTKSENIKDIHSIDVMRVLPFMPNWRQLGSSNNGAWGNEKNANFFEGAPESNHYTVPVDLVYDRKVTITSAQEFSNPILLKPIIMAQFVRTAGMTINIITYAKQIEGFFRNGDNFDKAKAHDVGGILQGDVKPEEIDAAVFAYDPADVTSATDAFQYANAFLDEGVPEIGALYCPRDERQAFITTKYRVLIQKQFAQNASEAAVRINTSGYMNPFGVAANTRINLSTGLCGTYDGLDLFLFSTMTRKFVYVALGLLGTSDDSGGDKPAVRATLDKMRGMIVYGAGTLRGIVGPMLQVKENPNQYSTVNVLPYMKLGVECIHGATIKMIIDGGAALATRWTAADIAKVMNTIKFTPIDGVKVTAENLFKGIFSDGKRK